MIAAAVSADAVAYVWHEEVIVAGADGTLRERFPAMPGVKQMVWVGDRLVVGGEDTLQVWAHGQLQVTLHPEVSWRFGLRAAGEGKVYALGMQQAGLVDLATGAVTDIPGVRGDDLVDILAGGAVVSGRGFQPPGGVMMLPPQVAQVWGCHLLAVDRVACPESGGVVVRRTAGDFLAGVPGDRVLAAGAETFVVTAGSATTWYRWDGVPLAQLGAATDVAVGGAGVAYLDGDHWRLGVDVGKVVDLPAPASRAATGK